MMTRAHVVTEGNLKMGLKVVLMAQIFEYLVEYYKQEY